MPIPNKVKQQRHRSAIRDRAVVNLNIELPESLRDRLRRIAAQQGVPLKKLINDSLTELANCLDG
jgi:predicted DNA binding CopG/RHH family protein